MNELVYKIEVDGQEIIQMKDNSFSFSLLSIQPNDVFVVSGRWYILKYKTFDLSLSLITLHAKELSRHVT